MLTNNPISLTLLAFILLFFTGFRLRLRGKPYGVVLNTVHKLIGLAMLVFVSWLAYPAIQAGTLDNQSQITLIATVLLFGVTILSGGFLSMERRWPAWVNSVHLLLPFLTMISTLISLILI